ncbi:MAG: serine/threonine-protein kinase [Pirellulales bacterium]
MILRSGEQPVPSYRLQERLGRGAIGEVWKASAPGGTSVALKFVNLAGKPAIKELRALQHVKQVRHANLTPIHAFWMLDPSGEVLSNEAIEKYYAGAAAGRHTSPRDEARPTTLIIAMQIGDESLADRLEQCKREGHAGIPVDELLDYMRDAAKGLDFLNAPRHDLGAGPVGIQHCDVKPQNILLMGDSASVCDFGLARVLGESHTTSAMAGSPAYMAPECIEGAQPSDATDQYSLAISYVELRTGNLPFRELNYGDVLHAHLTGGLKLDALAEPERQVIVRATSRNPANRFPSCVALVKALRRAIEGPSTTSTDGSLATSGYSSSGYSSSGSASSGFSSTDASLAGPSSFDAPPQPPATPPSHAAADASRVPRPAPPAPSLPVPPPSSADTADARKLQVAQLTREGNFESALAAIDQGQNVLSPAEVAQLRTAVGNRWFAHTVTPLVDKHDFMAAITAVESGPAQFADSQKNEWLADLKSRWTRYAAGQLKRGRKAP